MIKIIIVLAQLLNLFECHVVFNGGHPYYHYQQNLYIDNSTLCTKLYYSTKRVVHNCSSLNIANDYSIIPVKESVYVTELLLANNSFRLTLPYREINKYDSLYLLDLSSNSLNEFTTDLQLVDCSGSSLKELILNSNSFSRVPLVSYACMLQLERLRLNNNKNLINFDDNATFSNPINLANTTKQMPNLKLLDVSFCSIEILNSANFTVLSYFPNLVHLNLVGNKLKIIYANPFLFLTKLTYLSFELNQLKCDSNLMWMKQYFSLNKQILQITSNGTQTNQVYSPTCFSDLTQNFQNITTFDDSLFQTQIYLASPISSSLTIRAGNTVDLQCDLYSKPAADLWWTFNDRVLSRIVAPDSPYEFIENFNASFNPLNKTSVLRLKNVYPKLSGVYSCRAYYLGFEPANKSNIVSLGFTLNVTPDPNQSNFSLDGGAIAGIVIGCIVFFILLCLLLFLIIFCCCYRRVCCADCCCCCYCCFKRYDSSKKSYYSTDGVKQQKTKAVSELEENASGFKDINKTKPNYVSNTMLKTTAKYYDNNMSDENNHNQSDSSMSWHNSPNEIYIPNHENINNNNNQEILVDFSSNANKQEDLLDSYDENNLYSMNTSKKRDQFQVYTIKHPIDYGSTYNTNEGYIINDPNELEQINTYMDHHHQQQQQQQQQLRATTNQYTNNYISSEEYSRNIASLTNELINTDTFKQKQYIYGTTNQNDNFNQHEFTNPSFIKYDSDV